MYIKSYEWNLKGMDADYSILFHKSNNSYIF